MTFNAEFVAVPQRINPLFVTLEVTVPKAYLKNETKNKVKNENAWVMSSGGFFVLPFFFFLSVLLIEPSNLASSNQVQALFIQIVYSDFCTPEEMF